MKNRIGFVSNSSSCSFLISTSDIFIVPQMPKLYKDKKTLLVPYTFGGEVEFGRQRYNYKDFGSRLNFAYLMAYSIQKCRNTQGAQFREEFLSDKKRKLIYNQYGEIILLEQVLKENILGLQNIKWFLIEDEFNSDNKKDDEIIGYIDHGSSWYEKPDNYWNIFKNKKMVFEWLFGKDNYIANRSDEYEDASELEVDHHFDYYYNYVNNNNLYYNQWDNPEMFDKKGNFIE